MIHRVMDERTIQQLESSNFELKENFDRAYKAANECIQIIRILQEVNAKNIEREYALRKARAIVQDSLTRVYRNCRVHLRISDVPLAKVVQIKEYARLARLQCKGCGNFRRDGDMVCPVLATLSFIQ